MVDMVVVDVVSSIAMVPMIDASFFIKASNPTPTEGCVVSKGAHAPIDV
jgi:hypothetical protein